MAWSRTSPVGNRTAQQKRFNDFRQEFNHERPHEALEMMTPASRYEPSPRHLPAGEPGLVKSHDDYRKEWFGDAHSPASEARKSGFKELLLMPRAEAIGVGAFLYPSSMESREIPRVSPMDLSSIALLRHAARSTCAVSIFDLTPASGNWANELDHHPSGETNRVAAQAVLRAFEQDWLALVQSSSKLLE